jgi:hypothetical protein
MAFQWRTLAELSPGTTMSVRANHRILGTIGMAASPFLFLSFVADGFTQGDSSRLGAILGLVFAIGWLSNVAGLRALGVAGQRRGAKILLPLMTVTVAVAAGFQVFEFADPGNGSLLYTITDIAWPFSMLLLLITGIAAIRAHVFDGWLRFTPLVAALWLPTGIVMMGLLGTTAGQAVAGIHVALGWLLVGYAVHRGGRLSA